MRVGRVRKFLGLLARALSVPRGKVDIAIDGLEDECALDAGFDVASANCTELALMMLQPDGVPGLRERYGGQATDQVLRSFAGCVESCLEPPFSLFRLGDAEFCCILPGTSEEVAASVGETIRTRFAAMMTLTSAGPIFASASIGVASSRQSGFNVDTLRAAARVALGRARSMGGNRVESIDSEVVQGQSAKLGAGAFPPSSRERAAALR